MKTVLKTFLLYVLFLLPVSSFGWGLLGHRIVGQIADAYLTPAARQAIRKILGTETLAMGANWADFIKADSNYRYLDRWHYADFEKGLNYEQFQQALKSDTAPDAYRQLNYLIGQLKRTGLPADEKKMDLLLLIHIVGDVHQPLHVSPEGNSGGNNIKVQWFGAASNIHKVWDSELIEFQQLSYTEYATYLNHTTAAERKRWQTDPLSKWFYDSYVIAGSIEDEIRENNPRLSYRYNYDHISTLNMQLLKGGVRLAGLLNSIFH
jgi:S1/P1 Nuclease